MTEEPPDPAKITFGLPVKASKLEKFLLKLVEIYSYDVLRNNLYDALITSPEYQKHWRKCHGVKLPGDTK